MDGDQASPVLMDVAALTKRYGEQFALADVAFEIRAGEVLGIIGWDRATASARPTAACLSRCD